MRGTLQDCYCLFWAYRITPAHAGNTIKSVSDVILTEDHPRACGEHALGMPEIARAVGSPPRMRGTLTYDIKSFFDSRITPAHAGNTALFFRECARLEDHPRACGEHYLFWPNSQNWLGSPPRMRGTLPFPVSPFRISGITPAHAGNTF